VRNCHCLLCSGGDATNSLSQEVARWGWHVVVDPGGEAGPPIAYTVGLWHSFGHAEVTLVGLDPAEMAAWLHMAGSEVLTGRVVCPDGQLDDILGSFAVLPRPVLAGWHRHLFGDALRFYRGQPVPIVQLARGDETLRLWERLAAPPTPADWPFPVSPDALVLTSAAIAFGEAAVAGVVHDEEGEWQFLDGPNALGELTIVHLAHVAGAHPELTAVADLPPGWEAWQDGPGRWLRTPLEADPDPD